MDDNNKIAEFQRRTGVKDDNVSKQILQKNGWDLEKSVVEHRSSKNSIYKTLFFIIKLPFTPIIYLTSGIFSLGKSVLFSFLPSSTTPQRVTPEHTLFIQKFEETYGDMHPAFYQGNFQQAAEKAKNEFQFLLVYIHAATNPKTEDFCKNTLCTQVVSDYVNTNFVFWAGDITQRDAYKTGHILGATSYPFIAIIHCSGDNKIQVLDRFVANVPLDEFIERLGNIQELHSGLLQLDKGRANQTEEDHEVISRQDEAYQQSLLKDMERQRQEEEMRRKLREEKELEELLKKKQQEEIHQQNLMKEKLEQEKKQKEELRKKQLEEKKKQLSEEPPEGNDVCQIMILLLNGERVKRRFLFSDKLSSVFDYVDVCLGEAEYEKYCLVTAFPRKVFERSEKTLKESEFTSKMSLIFEEVYEEDKN